MSAIGSTVSAVTQAVSDVANDVKNTAAAAVGDTAAQIAKTPLDILEELLGTGGGGDVKKSAEEQGGSSAADQSALQQKMDQDATYRTTQHQSLHTKIQEQSQQYYEQKKQLDAQERLARLQQEEQKKFEIKQLEKRKSHDYQLQMAKDASSAEKRVGAG